VSPAVGPLDEAAVRHAVLREMARRHLVPTYGRVVQRGSAGAPRPRPADRGVEGDETCLGCGETESAGPRWNRRPKRGDDAPRLRAHLRSQNTSQVSTRIAREIREIGEREQNVWCREGDSSRVNARHPGGLVS
jgi:hypothetical protein